MSPYREKAVVYIDKPKIKEKPKYRIIKKFNKDYLKGRYGFDKPYEYWAQRRVWWFIWFNIDCRDFDEQRARKTIEKYKARLEKKKTLSREIDKKKRIIYLE